MLAIFEFRQTRMRRGADRQGDSLAFAVHTTAPLRGRDEPQVEKQRRSSFWKRRAFVTLTPLACEMLRPPVLDLRLDVS